MDRYILGKLDLWPAPVNLSGIKPNKHLLYLSDNPQFVISNLSRNPEKQFKSNQLQIFLKTAN